MTSASPAQLGTPNILVNECGETRIGWFGFWHEIQVAEEGWDSVSLPFRWDSMLQSGCRCSISGFLSPPKAELQGLLVYSGSKLASAEAKERVGSL